MAIRVGGDLPDLSGATEWSHGPVTRDQLIGHPTLVHFWAVSCGICSEQMPQIVKWHERIAPRGMRFVGVHAPRSERDTDVASVKQAIEDYGLTHPIAVDNLHAVTDLFENKFVPAFYVFDAEGHLRHYAAGEQGITLLEKAMERVLTRNNEARSEA